MAEDGSGSTPEQVYLHRLLLQPCKAFAASSFSVHFKSAPSLKPTLRQVMASKHRAVLGSIRIIPAINTKKEES